MRVDPVIVARAREGSLPDIEAIVRAYEGSLFALALSSTRNPEEAEDAVQEVFARLLAGLRDLRAPVRFEAWIFALARNELASRGRAGARSASLVRPGIDPDSLPSPCDGEEAARAAERLGPLFSELSPEQAEIVALRYGAGLSVAEAALACGIARSVAKSRLHEALALMRAARGRGKAGDFSRFRIPVGMEERIMENAEMLRLGARLVERMAIYDQARLATLARKGEKMDASVLEAMGRIEGGKEFLRRTGAEMKLRELGCILNYGDPYTEKRLVEELERTDAETAEELKAGMFVFEDFTLCDGPALACIVDGTGIELFAQGLAGCAMKEREAILATLDPARRAALGAALSRSAFSPEVSRAAQQEAISLTYGLEHEGRIETLRGEEAGPRGALIRLAR
jgi:RNA polymerase sigma-70 factor, ECF subfamily